MMPLISRRSSARRSPRETGKSGSGPAYGWFSPTTADMSPSTHRLTEPHGVGTLGKGVDQVCERIEPDGHTVDRRPGDLTIVMAVKQAG